MAPKTTEKKTRKTPAARKTTPKKTAAEGATLSAKERKRQARPACQVAKCKRRYRAKGYCVSHYREWRHGKFGTARYKECSDINCRLAMAMNRHGYCENHYQSYFVKGEAVAKAPAAEKPAAKEGKEAAA